MQWDAEDGYMTVRVDEVVCGDVGFACYNGASKSAQTYFRFSTHSSFLSPGMVKLSRSQARSPVGARCHY